MRRCHAAGPRTEVCFFYADGYVGTEEQAQFAHVFDVLVSTLMVRD